MLPVFYGLISLWLHVVHIFKGPYQPVAFFIAIVKSYFNPVNQNIQWHDLGDSIVNVYLILNTIINTKHKHTYDTRYNNSCKDGWIYYVQ